MAATRIRRIEPTLLLPAVGIIVALVLASCGKDDFPDRQAIVEVDGRSTTFQLEVETCGLDGDTVFVLGHADGGAVLQAVVGVDPDDPTDAEPAASGITVSDGPIDLGAFGADAWKRRGEEGDAPGVVTDVAIRGARVQLEGEAVELDDTGQPSGTEREARISLDARCDLLDD